MPEINVSQRVRDNEYFLRALMYAKSVKQRRLLLYYAKREEILAIAEIVANYLNGNIHLNNEDNFSLYVKNKRYLRVIGFKGRKSWKKRKQAAVDLGRVLIILLNDTLPILLQ